MWRLAEAYKKGQHKYQMGNNTNLVDYCYVGSVADAHILAADRLAALASSPPSTADDVSGQVFFVTDGKPRPYWNFPHMVFKQLGHDGKDFVVLPKLLCLFLAFFSELWASIFGGPAAFPRFIVIIATQEQWYNIDKVLLSRRSPCFSEFRMTGAKGAWIRAPSFIGGRCSHDGRRMLDYFSIFFFFNNDSHTHQFSGGRKEANANIWRRWNRKSRDSVHAKYLNEAEPLKKLTPKRLIRIGEP
jgi:hypothetical protein